MQRISRFLAMGAAALLVSCLFLAGSATAGKKKHQDSDPPREHDQAAAKSQAEIAPGLLRAPYLQSLGSDSVLVVWDSSLDAPASVDFGLRTPLDRTVAATSDGTGRRVAVLRGLQSGKRYMYRVRAGEQVLAEGPACEFLTDGGRSQRSFAFFATGDIGDADGEQSLTAASILRADPRPELGIITGDVVYSKGKSKDYDANLMHRWGDLLGSMPVWPALGNHDWKSDPETNFRREWYLPNNEHWYSFDFGSAHFVALDTGDGKLYQAAAQLAWLEHDLTTHAAEWTFVFFHHPGLTCTYKGPTRDVVELVMPILQRHRVDVVFNGHAHTYERLYPIVDGKPVDVREDPNYVDPQGPIYIVTGAGSKTKEGGPTKLCGPTAFFKDRTVLWSHIIVEGPRCTIRAVETDGDQQLDRITITKTGLASRVP
jgi:acid phosphatase type 7